MKHTNGPHRVAETNASKEVLIFLSLNEASVSNTWFAINKLTWQHPQVKKMALH